MERFSDNFLSKLNIGMERFRDSGMEWFHSIPSHSETEHTLNFTTRKLDGEERIEAQRVKGWPLLWPPGRGTRGGWVDGILLRPHWSRSCTYRRGCQTYLGLAPPSSIVKLSVSRICDHGLSHVFESC